MAVSRAQSESGSVVNTKFGSRQIIDLPGFAFQQNVNYNSNLADVPPRMFGPREYSYNVGKNVPRDHSLGGYVGQYYSYPNQMSPRGYQNSTNLVQESNVVPYPSYNTMPNIAPQQPTIPPQGNAIQQARPSQNTNSEKEVHRYYGPNGEELPGPPENFMRPRPQYTTDRKPYPMNFKIDATLEYGKMVSIRIKEGNVSFRDIPDFVIKNCMKTYRVAPRTDVTIVAENGEYNIYATPDLVPPLVRHSGYMYDPNIRDGYDRRATVYPRSYSPNRAKPEHDIYTKKYNGDYFVDDVRRHTAQDYFYNEPREVREVRRNEPREVREVQGRNWYSSNYNRERYVENNDRIGPRGIGPRDPQRKPLPMKPMNIRKHERTA